MLQPQQSSIPPTSPPLSLHYYILSHHHLRPQLSLSTYLSLSHSNKEPVWIHYSMEYYMDEKWKLSKEDRPHSSSKPSMSRSVSTKSSLQKSFSTKNPFGLSRSTSQKSSSSKSALPRSSSQRCSGFTRKCTNLAKEQKAKFYIVKRCITMLVSWKKNGDS